MKRYLRNWVQYKQDTSKTALFSQHAGCFKICERVFGMARSSELPSQNYNCICILVSYHERNISKNQKLVVFGNKLNNYINRLSNISLKMANRYHLLPLFLPEIIHHSDAYARHYEQNHRIPPAPPKFRHVFKIHPVDAGN